MKKELIDSAITKANKAMQLSYVPYSGFHMGAAVVTDKDLILPGSLVENVSLGLAMCAERIALFSCVAQNAGKPIKLILVSERTNRKITFPCGACLQVAMELGGPELEIIACDLEGNQERHKISNLATKLPNKSTNK